MTLPEYQHVCPDSTPEGFETPFSSSADSLVTETAPPESENVEYEMAAESERRAGFFAMLVVLCPLAMTLPTGDFFPLSDFWVKIVVRALMRPVADQLPTIYQTLGENYIEKVLPSIIDEPLKSVSVIREIRKIMIERAAYFNMALDDVSITTMTFGKEFIAAAEATQVAVQEAERAKFMVEKAKRYKQSAIIKAQLHYLFRF
ncbi:hypothetical protein ACS0TY_016304 [Phlomoides rotata]